MKNNDFLEKENFRRLIEADGSDRIEDRLKVVDAFLSSEEHMTLEEIYRLLESRGEDIEPEFVRQCLHRMVDLGFAQRKEFADQPIRYEHRHLGIHHDHLICTKCGKIVEFANDDLEKLQIAIAAQHGFHILQHRLEIYGLCDACMAQRKPLMPLSMAKPGEIVAIRDILSGAFSRARLAALGLRLGDTIEIISNAGQGNLIFAHNCSRMALGRGIAQKLLVSPVTPETTPVCTQPLD
ncbi:transcriptional repressor [Desulfatiglans anilini]|uniref:transcriptional repressor n=1 Tax=Desulfatiglans anilini TaxID=90728 RepID=UPI00040CB1BD|nr:transcriptional repressor [Desulfatiglans anilini]